MFFDVAAQMQQLVARRTQLDADLVLAELLHQDRVFEQREAVTDTLRVQQHRVVQVRVCGILGAAGVEQCLAGVEHEWNLDAERAALLDHGEKLVAVEPDVIRTVFSPD